MLENKVRTCSICKELFEGYGHNPEPIMPYEKRCCELCNSTIVVPIRIFGVQHRAAMEALMTHGFSVREEKPRAKGGKK